MNPLCNIPNGVGYLYLKYKEKYPSFTPREIYKVIRLHSDIQKILKESCIPENS